MADHIHRHDDGRGMRDIYVNGNKINCAFYADTHKGVVWFYPRPYRIDRTRGRVYARKLRGQVKVVFRGR